VEISDSKILGKPQLAARASESIGLLRLHGGEKIFAIDGQHRVEAIKLAISQKPDLEEEDQCAIFVAHDKSEEGRERTRRLFSTLNRYAKPVSKGEIVALDEDDALAIVTRRLVEEYEPLTGARVSYAKQRQISPGEKVAVTTILALAEMVETISLPVKVPKKVKEGMTRFRPAQAKLDELFLLQVTFWDALRRHFAEIKEATDAAPSSGTAGRYRTREGGHLLFRPIAQKAFSAAVRVLMDRAKTKNAQQAVKAAVARLSSLPMRLADGAWVYVFWDPIKSTVIQPKPALALNLMLHLIGSDAFPESYDLLGEYRSALKNENAKLPTLK
jgi:DNA sulfur modification protein DndB